MNQANRRRGATRTRSTRIRINRDWVGLLWWAAMMMAPLTVLAPAVAQDAPPSLYEEDVAASDPLRTAQAEELTAYLDGLRDDRSALDAIFQPDFSSVDAYIASKAPLRQRLQDRLGYPPPGKPDDEPAVFDPVGEDDVAVYHRFRISVLPRVHAIGLYIVPKGKTGRLPLIVAMHGGGGSPEVATFHGGANYHDMVRGAVARGYAVWAPQHLYKAKDFPDDVRQRIDARARLVGSTLTAIEIAKITRGLDVVLQRPEIDPDRVGMIGLSYGGFYTLFTTALEPRIKVAVASCPYGDRSEHFWIAAPADASDRRFPDGASLFRDAALVALICPRPLEFQVGLDDDLFKIDEYRKGLADADAPYQKLGLPDRFRVVEFQGGHEFHGASAWEFLERHLR